MGEPLLELQDLDVHYGAIHALRGISFRVGQGEIVTLIGANGAGKTTTLRAVSGMLRPSGGQIRYEGTAIAGFKPHRLVARGGSRTMATCWRPARWCRRAPERSCSGLRRSARPTWESERDVAGDHRGRPQREGENPRPPPSYAAAPVCPARRGGRVRDPRL